MFKTRKFLKKLACLELKRTDLIQLKFLVSESLSLNTPNKLHKIKTKNSNLKLISENKSPKTVSINDTIAKTPFNSEFSNTDLKYKIFKDEVDDYWPLINKLRNDTKGEQKKILLEGPRLVLEAIRAGVKLSTVFFSDRKQLNASKVYKGEVSRLFKVSPKQMKMFSATCHPPGIIALVNKRDLKSSPCGDEQTLNSTLLLHHLNNPGHLGTILRTAAAVNFKKVIITPGHNGCNPWDVKVLRAGMGAHLHTPLAIMDYHTTIPLLHNASALYILQEMPAPLAQYKQDHTSSKQTQAQLPCKHIKYTQDSVVVVSGTNFGHLATNATTTTMVTFPDYEGCGINIAMKASVLFYDFKRQAGLETT